MNLEELKKKSPAELITQAEKLSIENPSTLRKQEILFAILKKLAQKNEQITGGGVLEVLQDGCGFLRAIESRNNSGETEARINLSTIHGAKGGEADNVMLMTDLSRKAQESMEINADDETRVFYVGATRARDTLHIVQPQRYGGFII